MKLSDSELMEMSGVILAGFVLGLAKKYEMDISNASAGVMVIDPQTGEARGVELNIKELAEAVIQTTGAIHDSFIA